MVSPPTLATLLDGTSAPQPATIAAATVRQEMARMGRRLISEGV